MCGIAGVLDPDLAAEALARQVAAMAAKLVHRGPDDEGAYSTDGLAMAMRRLEVIDLETGAQPIWNEDRTVVVVYNGEIYNYRALRDRLQAAGHRFATKSDTEVLVHAYEERGLDFVRDLRGMFAFSLWDTRKRRLVLARDPLGIKPLYLARAGARLAWASELKALEVLPWVDRSIDLASVDAYLEHLYVPAPRSILRGATKLEPATILARDPGGESSTRFWAPPSSAPPPRSDDEWLDLVDVALARAIRAELVADVPVGVFLSGGLDSSAIAVYASRASDRPIETFSAGFDVEGYDERPAARAVAEHVGARHHEFVLRPQDVTTDLLAALAVQLDEPHGDDAAVPTYLLSKLARTHVTVALSGAGGDELFGGYTHYLGSLVGERYDRLPAFVRRGIVAAISKLPDREQERSLSRRLRRFAAHADESAADRHRGFITQLDFGDALRRRLWREDARRSFEPFPSPVAERFREAPGDAASKAMRADLQTYLVDDVLAMTDRTSMWASLEVRVPLLDQDLVELALGLPTRLKLGRGRTKSGLRKLLGRTLPKEIVERRKQGFAVPISRWLHTGLRERLADLARAAGRRAWFEPSVVESMLAEHGDGRADHSRRVWQLAMLELWLASRSAA